MYNISDYYNIDYLEENFNIEPDNISTVKGIVQYDKPYIVDNMQWLNNHIDCRWLVLDIPVTETNEKYILILAYPISPEYNNKIYEIKKNYPNSAVEIGIHSGEVNFIG